MKNNAALSEMKEEEMKIKFLNSKPIIIKSSSQVRKEELKKLDPFERLEQRLKAFNSYKDAA